MAPVRLYVYDLSNGTAKQLSLQLTGRQIDGIWHTSIVIYEREIWYGQGINTSRPGQSHLGQPLEIVDLGETEIDKATFWEYIESMKEHYTADKYHLLDFNCNSFTNDVAGFLTGGSIPAHIKDLPVDFLNNPFGAALRPTIDGMYRRAPPGALPRQPPPSATSAILQGIAQQAAATGSISPSAPAAPTSTLTAPVQICSNPASLRTILSTHKAVTVFFTSATCGPCRMIEPVFDDLAHTRASPGIAFSKVDMGVGLGNQVAQLFNVRVTPTFLFFVNGNLNHEMKGADAPELRSQVDFLIYEAFPPHAHAKLRLDSLRGMSLDPILFAQVPNLDALSAKFLPSIDRLQVPTPVKDSAKMVVSSQMIPFLRKRFGSPPTPNTPAPAENLLRAWTAASVTLIAALPANEAFPLIDLWRLAILDTRISTTCSLPSHTILPHLIRKASTSASDESARNVVLTALRLASNAFANPALARQILSTTTLPSGGPRPRDVLTELLVLSLLHETSSVRQAAASLAFNIASFLQRPLMDALRKGNSGQFPENVEHADGDWEVELVSALVESLGREENEDVVHRLAAALGFLVHLSPHLEQVTSLLEVLPAKSVLEGKLADGACGEKGITSPQAKKLIQELAEHMLP